MVFDLFFHVIHFQYIVQPGYKTLSTQQINTTQAIRTVQPPDEKTQKPTKWEKKGTYSPTNCMHTNLWGLEVKQNYQAFEHEWAL